MTMTETMVRVPILETRKRSPRGPETSQDPNPSLLSPCLGPLPLYQLLPYTRLSFFLKPRNVLRKR